ncbi:phage tail assembly chaperone family protein, TAC [Acinetobacter sp.]|uniref:phage tail assembly chaperone family protein, TAC n=1 Tax=Acinetobacter sp. TaxID=472 RepID=UPI00388FBD05
MTTSKLTLDAIIQGSLVKAVHAKTVAFKHNGKTETVDIQIKQLPYAITEPLFTRLNKGEDVVSEWIALSLVDDEGKNYLSKKQIESNFTQSLAREVFNAIIGIEKAPKDEKGKSV